MFDINIVDKYRDIILDAQKYIWNNPESGYKEFKTNEYLINEFEKLGYSITRAENITGFYTTVDTGREGPTVLIMGELDGLIIPDHPQCDKVTGAVHSCGHHIQCACLLGIACVLKEEDVLSDLCGKIKLCAVPAEEGIEFDYRKKLKQDGKIEFFTGKLEFIKRGYFDDVDLAFMVHAENITDDGIKFHIDIGHNGLIQKNATFLGKSAHAGSNPYDGVNALNMANNALSIVNNLRESFKEDDHVRFHYIITHGGDSVNIIPNRVVVESYIRAGNNNAIKKYNDIVNRVFKGVAYAYGGNVFIEDVPGYATLYDDKNLNNIVGNVLDDFVCKDHYNYSPWLTSSTDLGDVGSIIPSTIAYVHCAVGNFHGNDFYIQDVDLAGVENVKFNILVIRELLKNNAENAKKVIRNYKSEFKTKKDFIEFRRSFVKNDYLIK